MICNKYKCIFIHQRKNAGSSIISSFGYTPKDVEWHLFNDGTQSPEWSKLENKIKNYLVFTVVRNPWDRFVSGWKYLPAYKDRPLDYVIQNMPIEGHDYRHLARSQLDILLNDKGEFVPDMVLRFENLEEDFRQLCECIGKPFSLPDLNKTMHNGFSEFHTSMQIEFVRKHFSKDIVYFDYHFPGEQLRAAQ